MLFKNDDIPLDEVIHDYNGLDNKRIDLDFCWVSLEDLKNGVKIYQRDRVSYNLEQKKEM